MTAAKKTGQAAADGAQPAGMAGMAGQMRPSWSSRGSWPGGRRPRACP
jgi:hypothetical protein